MSKYGLKIKNIKAGTLYGYNLGVRDRYDYTEAMFNNSLFSDYITKQGLDIYKGESTRDIICLEFDFGSRSYEEEYNHIQDMIENEIDEDSKNRLLEIAEKITENKDKFDKKSAEEIRDDFYENGVPINYITRNKKGEIIKQQEIKYQMLYRSSAKAKVGQVMFINEKFYDKAYDWLTMGLGNKLNKENAKIVEMSAYAPLTTSTIVDRLHIPIEQVVILKDQDSVFKTLANVVKSEPYQNTKKCIVVQEEVNVKNTLWDGMGLIESSLFPSYAGGMLLLRNHFFKMCGFKTNIQTFFRDWCQEHNEDYETYEITDMFNVKHKVKDIKVITTDNAIKWKKFAEFMGDDITSAYEYWCDRIRADDCTFGIVKTDHSSKLGSLQQLSYQMINTLPCTKEDIKQLSQTSVDYVIKIKEDNDEFEKFLRNNANEINHYEMMADLYVHNKAFANSKWFRNEKRKIIHAYINKLRKGKITVEADNLTVCGNPFALLLYAVGEDWSKDNTLNYEKGVIECYTTRFEDGECLCAMRNPHNSPNNICYLKNCVSNEMQRYFPFSPNILAVNCIQTDIQDRANGMDFDADFMLVTNNEVMVKCAKKCYEEYPTIVNALKESGITYQNTKLAYSEMDNKFAKSRIGIGWSSNLAQLAMTYYWTNPTKELYDNFIILSVLAQVIIDGCKREYEINGIEEITRIQKTDCMSLYRLVEQDNGKTKKLKCDLPKFMKYTKEVKYTKNGVEIPYSIVKSNKNKILRRINYDLVCPMNWLQEILDEIPPISSTNTIPTKEFFVKMVGKPNHHQMTKIRKMVSEYDLFTKNNRDDENYEKILNEFDKLIENVKKIKVGNLVTINRLIESALGLENPYGRPIDKSTSKYTRKMLNLLYKMDKNKFLNNFIGEN